LHCRWSFDRMNLGDVSQGAHSQMQQWLPPLSCSIS
jgi:hypothetical protein